MHVFRVAVVSRWSRLRPAAAHGFRGDTIPWRATLVTALLQAAPCRVCEHNVVVECPFPEAKSFVLVACSYYLIPAMLIVRSTLTSSLSLSFFFHAFLLCRLHPPGSLRNPSPRTCCFSFPHTRASLAPDYRQLCLAVAPVRAVSPSHSLCLFV